MDTYPVGLAPHPGTHRQRKLYGQDRTLTQKIVSLIDLVPCWQVERCLALQIEKQWTRQLAGNDVYDIASLTAAIPYCDVVVTEKLWVHLCGVSGLSTQYNTTVLSSVLDIAKLLA